MFEKVSGIRFRGGYFNNSTDFMLLSRVVDKQTDQPKLGAPRQLSFIYGGNGSGKTSIAEAFYEYAKGLAKYDEVELLNNEESLLNPSSKVEIINKDDVPLKCIYVFDDNYSKVDISFHEDSDLKAIVMRRDQQDISKKIQAVERELKNHDEKVLPETKEQLVSLNDKTNINSPYYHKNLIDSNLKGKWATRQKQITGSITAPVKTAFIDAMCTAPVPSTSIDVLSTEFEQGIKNILQMRVCKEVLNNPSLGYKLPKDIDDKITSILAKTIAKPQLNEREIIIMNILTHTKDAELVQKAKIVFSEAATNHCPMCFRTIEESEKHGIIKSIAKVFDTKESEDHRMEIENIGLQEITQSFGSYDFIDKETVAQLHIKITEFNQHIQMIDAKLILKCNNVYLPICDVKIELLEKYSAIEILLQKLEQKTSDYSEAVKTKKELELRLKEINKNIAFFENQDNITYYKNCLVALNKTQQIDGANEQEKIKLLNDLASLKAKDASIDIAVDVINKFLHYIFCSKKRLYIQEQNNKYAIYSHGERVEIKNLSMGEKNAIALCYFFSDMLEGCKQDEYFCDNCLVVLDDPISSFDSTNKIGVYTFLRKIFKQVLGANLNNRIIVFTHQFETMMNLNKVNADIIKSSGGVKANSAQWELHNRKLTIFNPNKYNSYSKLIQCVFKFANDPSVQHEMEDIVGNTMRKLLEGFSTFSYKVGIEELFSLAEILNLIPEQKVIDYFENKMIRLLLHGESHLQYRVQGYPEINIDEGFALEEKISSAKDVLVFILRLNPLHLKKHLAKTSDYSIVEQWEKNLFDGILK